MENPVQGPISAAAESVEVEQEKPNKSNMQLQNEINALKEENNYLENTLAHVYSWLDDKQNELGSFRQLMKNSINRSPMKMAQVKKLQEENQQKSETQQ